MKNKYLISISTSLLGLLVFLTILPACSNSGDSTAKSVSLSEMAFATTLDALNRPLDKKSYFPAATPKIYCCVKVSNAPVDTEIKADWVYIKGEDITAENTLMDSRSVKVDGTRFIAFSFSYSRPDALWIKGEYKVILYINGVPKVQGPFVIQ
jgi:hypothetical protein